MSIDDNTSDDFVEMKPDGDSTILRFPLEVARAAKLVSEFANTDHLPPLDLINEIHVVINADPAELVDSNETPIPDAVMKEMVERAMAPRSDLPGPSPLFSDEAFASLAGRVEALNRLFQVVCAKLVANGGIDNEDLFQTVRTMNSNFKEIMNDDNRVLAADRDTLNSLREFAEMLDDVNDAADEDSEQTDLTAHDSVDLAADANRRLEMVIGTDQANAMLAAIGLPFPDAADLDEIQITICPSRIHRDIT